MFEDLDISKLVALSIVLGLPIFGLYIILNMNMMIEFFGTSGYNFFGYNILYLIALTLILFFPMLIAYRIAFRGNSMR